MLDFLKRYGDTISFSSSIVLLATRDMLGNTVIWLEIIFYTLSSLCLLIGIWSFVKKNKAKKQIMLELIETGEVEIYDEKADKQVGRFKIILPEPTAIKTSKQMNNMLENGAKFVKLLLLARKGLVKMKAFFQKLAFIQWVGIFIFLLFVGVGVVAIVNPTWFGVVEPYILQIMLGLGVSEFPSIVSFGKVIKKEFADNVEAKKKETEIAKLVETNKERQNFINKCQTKIAQLKEEYKLVIAKWTEDHEFGLTTMTSAETSSYNTYVNAVAIVTSKAKEAEAVINANDVIISKLESEIEELRKIDFNTKA